MSPHYEPMTMWKAASKSLYMRRLAIKKYKFRKKDLPGNLTFAHSYHEKVMILAPGARICIVPGFWASEQTTDGSAVQQPTHLPGREPGEPGRERDLRRARRGAQRALHRGERREVQTGQHRAHGGQHAEQHRQPGRNRMAQAQGLHTWARPVHPPA